VAASEVGRHVIPRLAKAHGPTWIGWPVLPLWRPSRIDLDHSAGAECPGTGSSEGGVDGTRHADDQNCRSHSGLAGSNPESAHRRRAPTIGLRPNLRPAAPLSRPSRRSPWGQVRQALGGCRVASFCADRPGLWHRQKASCRGQRTRAEFHGRRPAHRDGAVPVAACLPPRAWPTCQAVAP
jgi:hypothetical protein